MWCDEILTLSAIAKTHPHSAYCAFVLGILHKWNYVMRTIESVGSLFQPLENVIHQHFIPALTEKDPCSCRARTGTAGSALLNQWSEYT